MFDIRSILEAPVIYRMLQHLLRNKKLSNEYVNKYIKPKSGDYVLDIGCGPADILEFLPEVKYYGFDSNCKYIDSAKKRFGSRGNFFCQELSEVNIPGSMSFDIVLAYTVLHHLNDAEAVQLFKLSAKCLKHGGRLVTFDGCHTENEGLISKTMSSLDRGKYIRDKEGYVNLARKVFTNVECDVRCDLTNIPASCGVFLCCTKDW